MTADRLRAAAWLGVIALLGLTVGCGGPSPTSWAVPVCTHRSLVGLVTDAEGLARGGRNAESWAGLQRAERDRSLCLRASLIESHQAADYQANLESLSGLGATLVIGSSPALGPAAAAVAKANPKTRYAVVGYASNGTIPNLYGVTFAADQAAFLAGAVAGLYTKANSVGGVYGPAEAPTTGYRSAYERGARYVNSTVTIYGVFQPPGPGFDDPPFGQARGEEVIAQGADVIFSAGRGTGSGALSAAAAHQKTCIGFEVDEYLVLPPARSCLLTSAIFEYSAGTETLIRMALSKTLKGPNVVLDAANGGIGLAPFHEFERRAGSDLRKRIGDFQRQLASGRIQP